MFKTFSRIAALVIAILMVCSIFAACAKKDEPKPTEAPAETAAPAEDTEAPTEEPTEAPTEEPTEEPAVSGDASIIGRWESEYNVANAINASLAQDETGMFNDLHLSDAFITIYLTFNEDGTFSMMPEEESYRAAMQQVVDEMIPFYKDFLMAMYSAFAGEGVELSEEQILEEIGIESWDQLGEQMLAEMDEEDDNLTSEGVYTLDGNRLSLDNSDVIIISVNESELTFESVESNADDEDAAFVNEMMPMVFHRIG